MVLIALALVYQTYELYRLTKMVDQCAINKEMKE